MPTNEDTAAEIETIFLLLSRPRTVAKCGFGIAGNLLKATTGIQAYNPSEHICKTADLKSWARTALSVVAPVGSGCCIVGPIALRAVLRAHAALASYMLC
jgi:hypothetical protein